MSRVFDSERAVVPATYSALLVDILAERGVAPARVLAGTGVDCDLIGERDARITFTQQRSVYANALRLYDRPGLGFELGSRETIGDHGAVGYAVQSARNLEHGLRILQTYAYTAGPLLDVALEVESESAVIAAREIQPLDDVHAMAAEELMTVLSKVVRHLTDERIDPTEVRFDYDPPAHAGMYERVLRTKVSFGRRRCELRFDARHLLRPLRFSDEETARACEERCRAILRRLGKAPGPIEELRRVLLATPGRFPDIDEAARALGVSARTLRRRLSEAGTTFRALTDEVRKGLALDYLGDSELTIDQIAELLDYTETANFHRAFKKWTGRTPGAYRK